MLPLEIGLQVLSILASFASGCWLGRSRCKVRFELENAEERDETFVDALLPCVPKKWRRQITPKSGPLPSPPGNLHGA